MRFHAILSGLLVAVLATAEPRLTKVFIQPLTSSSSPPVHLAEVEYSTTSSSTPRVLNFEFPDLPEGTEHVRVGVYDEKKKKWTTSTSLASTENFSKGYSPTILVSVMGASGDSNNDDEEVVVVGVALKGVLIDAGQTRDFGPKAVVHVAELGKQPEPNRPVVLSPEGRKVVQEEKTFLQKYWWLIAIGVLLMVTGGGGDGK